jgi:hypothetical protein
MAFPFFAPAFAPGRVIIYLEMPDLTVVLLQISPVFLNWPCQSCKNRADFR